MAGVVWLASYPKSGNTWMRLLLSNFLAGGTTPQDINQISLNTHNILRRTSIEDLTLVDSHLMSIDELERIRPSLARHIAAEMASEAVDSFIKIHDAYRRLPDGTPLLGGNAARAALYLVRDPRDVAVSLAHHSGTSIAKAVDKVISAQTFMGGNGSGHGDTRIQIPQPLLDWSDHIRSWTRQTDVPVFTCRYEDLRADTAGIFGRALAFLGIAASAEDIARAVAFSDFSELQHQESQNGFRERLGSATAPFFRSGRAGGWATSLTSDQAKAIVDAHGEVMAEFGYV